jgi:predicted membrane-bound spermidine synthase
MGFMLVEVSQMQRLIVFLGHPTYSLSVVLSTLLASSGIGSYTTRRIQNLRSDGIVCLLLLLLALVAFGLFSVPLIEALGSSTTPVRIALAIAMLLPPGFFMGMAFPLGLKLATGEFDELMPAFWGMNGAASICASVLAMLIAMNAGISVTFWSGFSWYAVAFGAYLWNTSVDQLRPA